MLVVPQECSYLFLASSTMYLKLVAKYWIHSCSILSSCPYSNTFDFHLPLLHFAKRTFICIYPIPRLFIVVSLHSLFELEVQLSSHRYEWTTTIVAPAISLLLNSIPQYINSPFLYAILLPYMNLFLIAYFVLYSFKFKLIYQLHHVDGG